MIRDLLSVVGAVMVALGLVLVMYVGYLYDAAEYERKEEERRRGGGDGR